MSSYNFCKVFQKEFLRNYLVYLAQVFRDKWNCYALSIFRNSILLASSDNENPMLIRQTCKQGFAYIKMNLRFTKHWLKRNVAIAVFSVTPWFKIDQNKNQNRSKSRNWEMKGGENFMIYYLNTTKLIHVLLSKPYSTFQISL